MKCPKCQLKNRDGAKFCGQCGYKFEITCPECAFKNQTRNKFCDECGHELRKIKEIPPVNYSEPQSYTPKFLADKILTTRSSIEGERKLVTVFFADVANYTAMSEKLDPEEVHQIMDGCFRILMDEIHKYEGTINQFTGDGVMALFGAPAAHEDHAQRACYAALSIRNVIGDYSEKVRKDCDIEFKMRIGINTGPVIVGAIGNDLRMDYTAIGDTTNLASRMESKARPGSILVSKSTYKIARDYFEFEPFAKLDLKGKEKPQRTYELIKSGKVNTRIRASVAKGLIRFVGRKKSMAALNGYYEQVQSGAGQVVGIVGEAGVGKSRFLLEFVNQIPKGEFTYFEGRCSHYGSSMIYKPILDILKHFFNVDEGDREFIIKKKIKEKTLSLNEKLENTLPPFHDLLSLKVDNEKYQKLDPQQKRERTFEAIRDLLIRISFEKPLIIAFEDIHWIDKTTEEFIDHLIGSLANNRIMLILLYRPEYNHQWGSRSYYNRVRMNQLGSEASTELVKAILEGGENIPEISDLILKRSDGNPLFIEEFTHSLLENGTIRKMEGGYILIRKVSDIQIPDTLHGIIAARMDRLEENLKRTMQVASVIGRDFAFRILQTITDMREQLKGYLLNLQGLEFVYEKTLFPELEYIFKHAITQEVAYNSLLLKRRKQIHERVGNAIEKLYQNRLEEFYEMLSYHYFESDNHEKGFEYSKLAGKKARKSASFLDAITYTKKSIFCLEKLSKTDANQRKIIDARTALARYCVNINYHVEAKDSVTPIADLAIEMNYQNRLPAIYLAIGSYSLFVEEEYLEGIRYLSESEKMSEQVGDLFSNWMASYFIGTQLSWNCEFEKGIESFQKCLDISEAANNITTICNTKATLNHVNYFFQGKIDLICKTSKESLKVVTETDDIISKGIVYSSYGLCCYCKGLLGEAEIKLLDAIAFCEKNRHLTWIAWSSTILGIVYFDVGDYQKAQTYHNKAILAQEEVRFVPSMQNFNRIGVVRAKVLSNETDIKLDCIFKLYKDIRLKNLKGWAARYIAEILLNIDDPPMNDTEDWIKKSIEADKRNGMMFHLGKDYVLYAEFYKRKSNQSKAKNNLNKAIDIFKECGADGWVEKYEKELSSIL